MAWLINCLLPRTHHNALHCHLPTCLSVCLYLSRELGSNIPRGKIFKMYRGNTEQLLRCRSKIDDIPEGCVASGSSGPFKALSPAVHPHPRHAASVVAVVAGGRSSEDNNYCLSLMDMGVAALDPPRCSSSSSTECASSLNMDAESASSSSSSSSGDSELGVTSEESNPSSSCDAKEEEAPSDSSSNNNNNNYFIGPNEPVFIGAKRYSEHFIFWQVLYLSIINRSIYVAYSEEFHCGVTSLSNTDPHPLPSLLSFFPPSLLPFLADGLVQCRN